MKVEGNEIDINEFGNNNILQSLKKLCENLVSDNNDKLNFKLVFSNETEFNAVAYLKDEIHMSNISIATIMELYHHALILMKRNDFFYMLGKEQPLIVPFEIWEFEYPEIVDLDNGYKQINFYEGPECDEKKSASLLMTWIGMEFLIFHEVGHHIGGHIEYIKDKLGLNELFIQGQEKIIGAKQYQLLEMDADAIAVVMLLDHLKTNWHSYSEMIGENTDLIPHIVFSAITLVFFLIKKDCINNFDENKNKYLPRDFRFYLVLNLLFKKMSNEYNVCRQSQDNKSLLMTVEKTNILLKELYINENRDNSLELDNLETIGKYYDEILIKEWKNLRSQLMVYSKIKLPD